MVHCPLIAGGLVGLLGCGDDSNNCEVRETEGCEDFTGLYEIVDIEELRQCYQNSMGEEVLESSFPSYTHFSFKTHCNCLVDIWKHMTANPTNCTESDTYVHDFSYSGNSVSLLNPESGLVDYKFTKCGESINLIESEELRKHNVSCDWHLERVSPEPVSSEILDISCNR